MTAPHMASFLCTLITLLTLLLAKDTAAQADLYINIKVAPYTNEYKSEYTNYTLYVLQNNTTYEVATNLDGTFNCGRINPDNIQEIYWNKNNRSNFSLWPPYADPAEIKYKTFAFNYLKIQDIQKETRSSIIGFLQHRQYDKATRYLTQWKQLLQDSTPSDDIATYQNFTYSMFRDLGNAADEIIKDLKTPRSKLDEDLINFGRLSIMSCIQTLSNSVDDQNHLINTDDKKLFKQISLEVNNWILFCRHAYRPGQSLFPNQSLATSDATWFYGNNEQYKLTFSNDLEAVLNLIRSDYYKNTIKNFIEIQNKSPKLTNELSREQLVTNIFDAEAKDVNISYLSLFTAWAITLK